jgi:hypothetical protein
MAHTVTAHYRDGHRETTHLKNPCDFPDVDADARANPRYGGLDHVEVTIYRPARRPCPRRPGAEAHQRHAKP